MTVESAAGNLRRMATIADGAGSPMYGVLLNAAADDLEAGGPTRTALDDELESTFESAMPLRFAAALHRLVLTGEAPELAPFYPSAGGSEPADELPGALVAFLEKHADELPPLIARPCQTNEVGRCAGLVLGFLEIARTGLPLRLLEVGASAGLNLRWDRFRYEQGGASWGPPDSPVRLAGRWDAEPEVFETGDAPVVERRGCDPDPMDPADPETALALRSSIWADQQERFQLLEGALQIAAHVPATVERSTAAEFLERELAEVVPGVATVVYHSVVWQYLSPAERDRVRDTIRAAGERASRDAPVAWLSVEPQEVAKRHRVRLTAWPGGATRRLAETGPHGDPVVIAR